MTNLQDLLLRAPNGVAFDSRAVRDGQLFFAIPGTIADGSSFVEEAFRKGATAAVVSRALSDSRRNELGNIGKVIAVDDVRETLAHVAAMYYGRPSRRMLTIGVTGTNGKTSTTWIIAQALARLRGSSAYVGTLGFATFGKNEALEDAATTTPDAIALQKFLHEAVRSGTKTVAMETSSHALDQRRVDAIDWDACVFTNLTRDHLDYHETLKRYGDAKARLFLTLLPASEKKKRHAIVNVDDPFGNDLADRISLPVVRCSAARGTKSDVQVLSHEGDLERTTMEVSIFGARTIITTQLIGDYNIENTISAAATLAVLEFPLGEIQTALAQVPPVPGRLERIGGRGIQIFVDYAHTPDALVKAQQSLRKLATQRLITVFGCGGDRDRGKRPVMGKVVAELSDLAVVTSDNPRSESPDAIIEDVLPGMKQVSGSRYVVEPDRKEAIRKAIGQSEPGDVILLAGKGHETYQEIQGVKYPFDDRQVARELLSITSSQKGSL